MPFDTKGPARGVVGKVIGKIRYGPADAIQRAILALEDTAAPAFDVPTGVVFVDHSIAVVVNAIARFDGGQSIGNTFQRAIAAMDDARGASSDHSRHTHGAAFGVSFVIRTIAIVVEAIAFFRGRRRIGVTIEHIKFTGIGALIAYTWNSCTAAHACAGNVIVDRAITVVVDSITRLHRSLGGLYARGSTRDAVGFPIVARPGKACITRRSFAGVCFVDEQIAIVVETIAKLDRRIAWRTSGHLPFFTRQYRNHTSADAARRHTHVVDLAITIVIHVVTRFRRRKYLAHTRPPRTREVT